MNNIDPKELLSECYQEMHFLENYLKALGKALDAGMNVENELNRCLDKYNYLKKVIKELKRKH